MEIRIDVDVLRQALSNGDDALCDFYDHMKALLRVYLQQATHEYCVSEVVAMDKDNDGNGGAEEPTPLPFLIFAAMSISNDHIAPRSLFLPAEVHDFEQKPVLDSLRALVTGHVKTDGDRIQLVTPDSDALWNVLFLLQLLAPGWIALDGKGLDHYLTVPPRSWLEPHIQLLTSQLHLSQDRVDEIMAQSADIMVSYQPITSHRTD